MSELKYRSFEFMVLDDYSGEDIDKGVVHITQKVIDQVDDSFRRIFYDINTPEEVAAHIAFNLLINRGPVETLDGWYGVVTSEHAKITGTNHWTITRYCDMVEEEEDYDPRDYLGIEFVKEITDV